MFHELKFCSAQEMASCISSKDIYNVATGDYLASLGVAAVIRGYIDPAKIIAPGSYKAAFAAADADSNKLDEADVLPTCEKLWGLDGWFTTFDLTASKQEERAVLVQRYVKNKKLRIPCENGLVIVAEQNTDPNYNQELFIDVEDSSGGWQRSLAIVRNAYCHTADEDPGPTWVPGYFEALVYDKDEFDDPHRVLAVHVDPNDNAKKRASRMLNLDFEDLVGNAFIELLRLSDQRFIPYRTIEAFGSAYCKKQKEAGVCVTISLSRRETLRFLYEWSDYFSEVEVDGKVGVELRDGVTDVNLVNHFRAVLSWADIAPFSSPEVLATLQPETSNVDKKQA